MALNYSDRETLLPKLLPQVVEAVRKYFLYLAGGGGGASQGRIDYATTNMKNIAAIASEVLPWLASEPTFIDEGTAITDEEIRARVETVLQNPDLYLPA